MYPRDNNPRQKRKQYFIARVGRYSNFGAYLNFYEMAVETLYREVSEQNATADMVAVPVLFLMRHTMELGYKFSLYHLCQLNGSSFAPEGKNGEGHSFSRLHARLRREYVEALSNGHVNERDHDTVEGYFTLTENGIKLFDSFDERSTKFRYPIDNQMPVFSDDVEINLLEMKDAYDQAMGLLGTVIDVIARPWIYYDGP